VPPPAGGVDVVLLEQAANTMEAAARRSMMRVIGTPFASSSEVTDEEEGRFGDARHPLARSRCQVPGILA
jgi:hypothetical protein